MARHALIAIAAFGFTVTGCVSSEKYNALKLEKDALVEQTAKSQTAEAQARSQADAWKSQNDSLIEANANSERARMSLQEELAAMREQHAIINERYKNALQDRGQIVGMPVDPVLNNELAQFAKEHPETEWDAARGTLRFKSDVTFAPGSATLTDAARQTVQKLSSILNSSAASKYEFLVAGHTDNVPVTNPKTKAEHRNNWYLSSHRAHAVGEVLLASSISPQRVGIVGYGDQRPIASNDTSAGKARNRRVEVLLLPNQVGSAPMANTRQGPAPLMSPQKSPTQAPILNKDAAVIDQRPILNK